MSGSLAAALRGEPVRVGTVNPAKLAAVWAALTPLQAGGSAGLVIQGVAAASGVPEQPVGWDEIVAGARNRARAALASGSCVLAFGIEDGLVELPGAPSGAGSRDPGADPQIASPVVYNVGCAWVTDGQREGSGFSSGFAYPPFVTGPAFRDREPIGALFDALWRRSRTQRSAGARTAAVDSGGRSADPAGGPEPAEPPSGRQGGNIGQLTQGRLDRAAYGAQAILCALVPFLHADLYD
ncbi:DUF84 family protein [Myxococcota bacterium]|nr:DUF84 family protein [Myxococcota bacterium]